jgi:hypothetical protein
MVEHTLTIRPDASSFMLTVGSTEVQLSPDDFSLIQEGVIPSGILSALENSNIAEDEIIKVARSTPLPEYNITISAIDGVSGHIRNGPDGLIQWARNVVDSEGVAGGKRVDVARFSGSIGPIYLIDGETRGIGLTLNGFSYGPMPVSAFYDLLREELSLTNRLMQKLKEIVNAWAEQAVRNKQAVNHRSSPIYIDNDGIIHVDFLHVGDVGDIATRLRDFHDKATHPLAYRTVLAWSLMAPLHDEIKRHADVSRRIQTPQVMTAGKTQGGKTPLGDFFIGKGYDLHKDAYFYPYQTVRTTFTLMRHLGETNLPALFDDLPSDWLQQHADDLKAYVQTGHFGDRGKPDQTVQEYRGKRSFIGTVNSSIRIDDDLAASMRIIIFRFTEQHRRRKNLPEWNALIDGLPDGFMIEIFRVMFEGQNIKDIANDAEKFQSPADWINYVIGKLNMLSQWFGIPEWPLYQEEGVEDQDSNAMEVAQAFLAEWQMIEKNSEDYFDKSLESQVRAIKYRSPIEGEFLVEWRGTRNYIWFTGPAFKTLTFRRNLKLPYRNATDFLNNIASTPEGIKVENEGKAKTKKIWAQALWCYCISLPKEGEDTWP